MTDGTAGWFRDPNDPALARWHDGDRWTEHTLVIADQTPGTEPPPPVITPSVDEPTAAFDSGGLGSSWERTSYTEPAAVQRGGLPRWAKVLAPLAVIAVVAAAFFLVSNGDDSDDDTTETAEASVATLDEAVDAARDAGLPDAISDQRAAALIERICDAANDPSEVDELGPQLASLPVSSTSELRDAVAALGVGASRRCEDDLDDEPDLIEDLQDAAAAAFATTTTALGGIDGGVDAGVDGGTDAGVDDGGDGDGDGRGTGTRAGTTRTTRRSGAAPTPTTARPPATTTTRPLPQAMPNTACSSNGAKAVDKTTGGTLTCAPQCYGPSRRLVWQRNVCQATTTTAYVPPPTQPTTAPPPTTCTPPNCDG